MRDKFASRCHALAALAPGISVLVFLRAVWLWVEFEQQLLPYYQAQGVRVMMENLAAWQHAAAAVVAYDAACMLVCSGLVRAGRVFRLVARGERIAVGVVRHLAAIASLVLYAALAKIPADALVSVLLTFNNPVGERSLRLGFSSAELVGIVAAGLLWALAWTLRDAVALRRENDAFI
jgi:cytosine/uracil/thiamine/allantoin permease